MRREWPTDIGPVDLMCRDEADGWIAVEIKRIGTIDAVEQLTRYLERIRLDPAMAELPRRPRRPGDQAAGGVLAESRGIGCVEVDLAVLRGEREPELTLFAHRPSEAVLTERARRRPADHAQPARAAQRGQRGDRERRSRPRSTSSTATTTCASASSPAPAGRSAPAWT